MTKPSDRPRLNFVHTSGQIDFLKTTGRRFWAVPATPRQHEPAALDLVFKGNAFEAQPPTFHQRPGPRWHALRRSLRALVLWLLQPSPFAQRARRR
jgi:hypothetical protein